MFSFSFCLVKDIRLFHFLAVVNRAAMHKAEQVGVESFVHTPRSGTSGSHGSLAAQNH